MKTRLVDFWIRLQASYWFIPSLMATSAIAIAVGLVHVDTRLGSSWLLDYKWINANTPAGARAVLSTVAGSMITVAGVTFSMTLLAVSHASAQIGPRLLTGFMRDRGNQFTLGTFVSTFLYCLVVLRTVHSGVESIDETTISAFVPHLAIIVSVGFAVMSVAVLIYYIHHIPQSISVANVVFRVGDELVEAVQCMNPDRAGTGVASGVGRKRLPDDFDENSCFICVSGEVGYLRVLDADGLLAVTEELDLIVKVLERPGDFAIEDCKVLQVYPARKCSNDTENRLRSLFSWGRERTSEQDVLFPAEQLVEILGKAMSPSVNGQHTAQLCLNQFERVFAELLRREDPESYRVDDNGKLRVIANPVTHKEFVTQVMRPIRQYIRGDWMTTSHLLGLLTRLRKMPQLSEFLPLLEAEITLTYSNAMESSMSKEEKELLDDYA